MSYIVLYNSATVGALKSMVKSFDFSNCGGFHPRPMNRNCKEPKVDKAAHSMDTNSQILHELKNLSSRMA